MIANDYDYVRGAHIPRGQDPAVFHCDKMVGALANGNLRLANAHALARIPHMSLTYRSASYSNKQSPQNPTIQLPELKSRAIHQFKNKKSIPSPNRKPTPSISN